MPIEPPHDVNLEIGHVLFLDLVGYSKFLIDEQRELQAQLNQIVRGTKEFRAAEAENKLVRLPTGDGMALVFFTGAEAPMRCALEISEELAKSQMPVRMGINTGPVSGVADVNDRSNIAGAGINLAQRVMDLGDAGHILLSKRAAEDLLQYRQWRPHLHELGEVEIKHGMKIPVVNLVTEKLGNREVPEKIRLATRKQRRARAYKKLLIGAGAVGLLGLGIGLAIFLRPASPFTESMLNIPEKSIAVLPFEILGGDEENAYFADGMQDDILTELSKIADLKVISRTSVMQYRHAVKNLREIARVLRVAYVLEGSARKVGNHVRVNAQLIDARTDGHLWAEQYDRDVSDVFAIQTELTQRIVAQLKSNLSPTEKAAIEEKPTTDVLAYDLFLRGRELLNNGFRSNDPRADLLKAAEFFNAAISHDHDFALGYCFLARTHLNLFWFWGYAPEDLKRAEVAVQTALRLAPNLGEAHLQEANFYYRQRNYGRALEGLVETAKLLPNESRVFDFRGVIERRLGHWENALSDQKKTLELDPRSESAYYNLISSYQMLHRYAEGERLADEGLKIIPQAANYFNHTKAMLALDQGDLKKCQAHLAAVSKDYAGNYLRMKIALIDHNYSEALDAARAELKNGFDAELVFSEAFSLRKLSDSAGADKTLLSARQLQEKETAKKPDQAAPWIHFALIEAALGRREDALRDSQKAIDLLPISRDAVDGPQIALHRAKVLLLIGQRDNTLELLEQLAKIPNGPTVGDLLDPLWDDVRSDPRFARITELLTPKK